MQPSSYYKILGVKRKASLEEIRFTYRKRAKTDHPDKNPEKEEEFKDINRAYETLSDPVKRARYDASTPEDPTTPEPKQEQKHEFKYSNSQTNPPAKLPHEKAQDFVEQIKQLKNINNLPAEDYVGMSWIIFSALRDDVKLMKKALKTGANPLTQLDINPHLFCLYGASVPFLAMIFRNYKVLNVYLDEIGKKDEGLAMQACCISIPSDSYFYTIPYNTFMLYGYNACTEIDLFSKFSQKTKSTSPYFHQAMIDIVIGATKYMTQVQHQEIPQNYQNVITRALDEFNAVPSENSAKLLNNLQKHLEQCYIKVRILVEKHLKSSRSENEQQTRYRLI